VEETVIEGTETVIVIANHAIVIGTEIEIADVTVEMIDEVIEIGEAIATVMKNAIGTGTGEIERTEMGSDGIEARVETERGDGMNRTKKYTHHIRLTLTEYKHNKNYEQQQQQQWRERGRNITHTAAEKKITKNALHIDTKWRKKQNKLRGEFFKRVYHRDRYTFAKEKEIEK
jgi:hypothetical protein